MGNTTPSGAKRTEILALEHPKHRWSSLVIETEGRKGDVGMGVRWSGSRALLFPTWTCGLGQLPCQAPSGEQQVWAFFLP